MPITASDLTDVLPYIRSTCSAATDEVFEGVTYWTDAQLASIANRNAQYQKVTLTKISTDGLTYKLECPHHWWIAPTGYRVYNDEAQVSIGFTYDRDLGTIEFSTATTVTHIEGVFVNLYSTIASVWEAKAAHRASFVNMKIGNATKIDMQQEYEHCLQMAQSYRNKIVRRFRR